MILGFRADMECLLRQCHASLEAAKSAQSGGAAHEALASALEREGVAAGGLPPTASDVALLRWVADSVKEVHRGQAEREATVDAVFAPALE